MDRRAFLTTMAVTAPLLGVAHAQNPSNATSLSVGKSDKIPAREFFHNPFKENWLATN